MRKEAHACKIEHIISDEIYHKMKKFVTNQSEVWEETGNVYRN